MKKYLVPLLIVLAIALTGASVWLGVKLAQNTSTQSSSPSPSQSFPATQSSGSPSVTTSATQKNYPMVVYFLRHPASDDDPSKVFAVNRISPTSGVGSYAISQLIVGPSKTETDYFNQVILYGDSNCGGNDFSLSINNGTATLKFCRPFDAKGVMSDAQAKSQIDATLKQFSTVNKVIILNQNDHCLFDLSGMDLCKKQ